MVVRFFYMILRLVSKNKKVKQLWKLYSITSRNMLTFADGFETRVAKNKKVK